MNVEQIEHELALLNRKEVTVVRPFFGTQSDSWFGLLTIVPDNNYPMKFEFVKPTSSTVFTAEDVVSVEFSNSQRKQNIIRLKGPAEYASKLRTVADHGA